MNSIISEFTDTEVLEHPEPEESLSFFSTGSFFQFILGLAFRFSSSLQYRYIDCVSVSTKQAHSFQVSF
jgi:hypothetical protein